jgi:hypothetical protein
MISKSGIRYIYYTYILTNTVGQNAGAPGTIGLTVAVLPAIQLVPSPTLVGDSTAEGLALSVHVAVVDLVGLAAPYGWKGGESMTDLFQSYNCVEASPLQVISGPNHWAVSL